MELSKKEIQELEDSLTEKQRLFCKYYIQDFHITNSAIQAGYSQKTAAQAGSRLLNDVNIQNYLRYLTSDRAKRLRVDGDRIVQEIAKIAFHNVDDLLDYLGGNVLFKDLENMEFPEIIKSIKVKEITKDGKRVGQIAEIQIYDKVKALELLGKHTALFTENLNLKNNGASFATPQNVTHVHINHRRQGAPLGEEDELLG